MVRPQPFDLPFDERDPAADVEAVELPAPTAADADELALDALRARLGDTAERRALDPLPSASSTYASSSLQPSTGTGSSTTFSSPSECISPAMKSTASRSSGVPATRKPSGCEPIDASRSTTSRR